MDGSRSMQFSSMHVVRSSNAHLLKTTHILIIVYNAAAKIQQILTDHNNSNNSYNNILF